jgi:hypothetical protein
MRDKRPTKKSLSHAKVIFCPSHFLEEFLDDYKGAINAKVLILGNSDRDFVEFDFFLPSSIKFVFVQNLMIPNSRTRLLPIGLENVRLGKNGLLKFYTNDLMNRRKNGKMLVGPFSMTHSEREFYLDHDLEKHEKIDILRDRLSHRDYADLSANYRFIASPRGNGLDTHRFWEALYRGSIPVVKKTNWSDEILKMGIPLISIEDWRMRDLDKVVAERSTFFPTKIRALWWDYWRDAIKEHL